jgi:hypothetical protein
MRTGLFVLAALLTVGTATSDAAQRRDVRRADPRDTRGRIDDRWDDRRYDARGDRYDVRGDVHVVFSTGDVRVVREHYAPRYRRLPPGLAKKYARTGYLPPGWQRKMQPLPWAVERRLSVLPHDYRRGVIDDHAVIYAPRTGVIIDATIVF